MAGILKGRYRARLAETESDIQSAQKLRFRTFIEGRDTAESDTRSAGVDSDKFDQICEHVLVEEVKTDRLICCFRLLPIQNGAEIDKSYSAQYYDLDNLRDYQGTMVEMGRFCVDPEYSLDADIMRVAWGAMTRFVDDNDVQLLFGCSSFEGTEAEAYKDAFALLKEKHLAPKRWLPRVKAPSVIRYASKFRLRKPNLKLAMKGMPPLLRSYLVLGGWVSDHAVVDNDLNTLHVFTGLEINQVPAGRARLLRATAS
jgi:putative hemolysin